MTRAIDAPPLAGLVSAVAKQVQDALEDQARAFSALGQTSRLRIVRLLSEAGPDGLPAGEIARRLELPQNGSSVHLSILVQAGLLSKTQAGRSAIYALRIQDVTALAKALQELNFSDD